MSSIFPMLIYSQNEILEITRDPQAQIHLLDNFRDFESHLNIVSGTIQELGNLDRSLFQAIQESANLDPLLKRQGTVDEKIKKLKTSIEASGKKGFSEKSRTVTTTISGEMARVERVEAGNTFVFLIHSIAIRSTNRTT